MTIDPINLSELVEPPIEIEYARTKKARYVFTYLAIF